MILQADNKEKLNKKDIDSVNSTQLNISGLSVSYSDSTVLENVTLQLKKGEILGIAGESGSGKSTLIKAMLTPLAAVAGLIVYSFASSFVLGTFSSSSRIPRQISVSIISLICIYMDFSCVKCSCMQSLHSVILLITIIRYLVHYLCN